MAEISNESLPILFDKLIYLLVTVLYFPLEDAPVHFAPGDEVLPIWTYQEVAWRVQMVAIALVVGLSKNIREVEDAYGADLVANDDDGLAENFFDDRDLVGGAVLVMETLQL